MAPILKDLGLFVVFPALCILVANASTAEKPRKLRSVANRASNPEKPELKPQIIEFAHAKPSVQFPLNRRAPGTLVRVRLENVVEALSETPVHAQVLDYSLGEFFYGGTLLGEGSADPNFSRMNVTFKFAKRRGDDRHADLISARALSLDGTLGLPATRKEGMFARGVLGGANSIASLGGKSPENSSTLQAFLLQALTHGFAQELSGEANIARNNAGVLTLAPGLEFYAELRDFFPEDGK